MRLLASALRSLSLLCCISWTASAGELFNHRDFSGWELIAPGATDLSAVCHLQPEGVIGVTGWPSGFIATTGSYANYRLHAEWRWSGKAGNGGVLIHISSGPKDRVWPLCFQVQIKNKAAGDFLPMAGATFAEPLTSAVDAPTAIKAHIAPNSENPVGEWNTCDILCRDDTIEVAINGVRQNRVTHATPRSGRIGFQLEGTPFELRNVTITPLK